MSIKKLVIYIYVIPSKVGRSEFASELFRVLVKFDLNARIIYEYPCPKAFENIMLLDASFEQSVSDISLYFPILKIFRSCPDFKNINFNEFIIYPFSDEELVSRIYNLYNNYKNIQQFQKLVDNFKSYLLNLSHDVYSPIKLVKSQIEYLCINNKHKSVNAIFDSTLSQLKSIVNTLESVPYHSIASDNTSIEDSRQDINFASLIYDIKKQFDLYASIQGVEIKVFIQNEEVKNTAICSNYSYLWRMVYNLVFNAIKYCVGGGAIKLSLSRFENILRWKVSDTGIGMSHLQLSNIQKYLAYDESNDEFGVSQIEANSRFGRGLVVVKLVANSLNAKIEVQSELGLGTNFIIDIPLLSEA